MGANCAPMLLPPGVTITRSLAYQDGLFSHRHSQRKTTWPIMGRCRIQ